MEKEINSIFPEPYWITIWPLCVCVHTYVGVHICMCILVQVCMCVWRSEVNLESCLPEAVHCIWRPSLLLAWSPNWLSLRLCRQAIQQSPPELCVSTSQCWGCKHVPLYFTKLHSFMWVWESNSDPHTYTASSLSTESSSLPWSLFIVT